jgi:hypothetical protein
MNGIVWNNRFVFKFVNLEFFRYSVYYGLRIGGVGKIGQQIPYRFEDYQGSEIRKAALFPQGNLCR